MTPSVPLSIPPHEHGIAAPLHLGDTLSEGASTLGGGGAGLAGRIGRALFAPSPAVTAPAERRLARLLAVFSFVVAHLVLTGAAATHLYSPPPIQHEIPPLLVAASAGLLGAYALSRTRHLRLATGAVIGVNWLLPASITLLGANGPRLFPTAVWFYTSILLAGTLSSARTALVLGGVTLAYPLVVSAFGIGGGPDDVAQTLSYLLNVSALTVVLTRHRARVEKDRNAQLHARNAELLALKSTLEQRVQLRTADLEKSRDDLDRAYEELRKNQQALLISEKMASLGRLTAGIAHEMSSPLAAVRASLSELRGLIEEYGVSVSDPDVTDEDHRAIAKDMGRAAQLADKAAERAAAFVRSIKSQTRDIGAHERTRFDAAAVVRDALQMLGHEVTASQSHVHVQCTEEPLEIDGAPGKLAQVVTNLVTNALDASAERGGGDVHVDLARHGGAVTLTVRDQGPGIPDDVLKKIFDPLFTTKPMGKGTGLGLTIVHDIVCGDFRGKVDVKTAPGQGAAFIVHLPARATAERGR